ncbi:NTP transferase domain-containing protein [Candidatus Woesearchaeota archaeon]|nr:NTP transferase domain-containing protein [Candidatus Woesearchaeota archaeon]
MKVILPCAGYGTRLSREITNGLPKHLLPVCGQPVIEYTLIQLDAMTEVDKVYLVTNDVFYGIFDDYIKRSGFCSKVTLVNNRSTLNENRLGTVGDITMVVEEGRLADDTMVILADNLYNFRLDEALHTFRLLRLPLVVSYDMKDIERVRKKLGVLVVGEKGVINRFEEKPENPESTLASTGIYIFPKETLHRFTEYKRDSHGDLTKLDRMGDFVKWLVGLETVITHVYSSEKYKWIDIGAEESYREAQRIWKDMST